MDLAVAAGAGITFGLILILTVGAMGRTESTPYQRVGHWLAAEEPVRKKRRRKQTGRRNGSRGWQAGWARYLFAAGIPLEPIEALAVTGSLVLILFLLFFLLRGLWGGCVGAVVGLVVPILIVRVRAAKRLIRLEKQLPELLELLAAGLRAGFSLTQALQHCAGQMADPLGPSLQLVNAEMMMGLDVSQALNRWHERLGSMDAEMVVSAILIQREVGGNLAELLDNISRLMRDRQDAQMEMKTLTAQGRMEGVIISLLPVVLGVIISLMNPHYMDPLFDTQPGRIALGAASVMGLMGIFLIQKITHIRY